VGLIDVIVRKKNKGMMRILGALLNLIAFLKSRKKSVEFGFGVNKTIM